MIEVRLEVHEGVALLSLNAPKRRNAITVAMAASATPEPTSAASRPVSDPARPDATG